MFVNFTNTGENEFKVDWLLKETKKEIAFAEDDLTKIKQAVSSFLKGTEIKKNQRSRRALPIAAVSCQEKAKTNAKNIEKLGKYTIATGDNSQQLANETDEKFFRAAKDLALLHEI